jgi:hypothetical protein
MFADEILLYQMPRNLPHDKDALTYGLQNPILRLPSPGSVVMLDVSYDGPRLLIFFVSQSSQLHCYVLNRIGHGVTPSSTPSSSPVPSEAELELADIPNIDHNLAYPVANN